MMKFLGTLNWGRILLVVVVLLGLVAMIVGGVRGCKQIESDENNQLVNAGETREREAGHAEVINNVEKARDASSNPSSNAVNSVCAKYDRNC